MSTDMKYEMQLLAEAMADAEFGKDFYELDQNQQFEVFGRAMDEWNDRRASAADLANDLAKERQ